MSEDPLVIYTDGRCEPDPSGVATLGFIAKHGDKEIHSHNAFVCSGPGACSAVAEYSAVISALEWLLGSTYRDQEVVIRTDAQQIAYQIVGSYTVRPTPRRPARLTTYSRASENTWFG